MGGLEAMSRHSTFTFGLLDNYQVQTVELLNVDSAEKTPVLKNFSRQGFFQQNQILRCVPNESPQAKRLARRARAVPLRRTKFCGRGRAGLAVAAEAVGGLWRLRDS